MTTPSLNPQPAPSDEIGLTGRTLDSLLSDINIDDTYSSQISALASSSPEIDEFISSLSAPNHEPTTLPTSSESRLFSPPSSGPPLELRPPSTGPPISSSVNSSNHSGHNSVHLNQNSSSNSNNNSFNNSNVSNNSSTATPAPRLSILAVATPTDLEAIPSAIAQHHNEPTVQIPTVPVAVATPLRNSNQGARNSSFLTEEGEEQVERVQTKVEVTDGMEIYQSSDVKADSDGGKKSQKGTSSWIRKNKALTVVFVFFLFGVLIVAIVVPVISTSNKNSRSSQDTPTVTLESSSYNPYQPLPLANTSMCPLTSTNTTSCLWKQIGNDLVGPTDGDMFGSKLRLGHTLKGTRFSISAPLYDDARGLTRVYDIVEASNGQSAANDMTISFHQVGQDMISNNTGDKLEGIMSDDGYTLVLASTDVSYKGESHIGYVGAYFLTPSNQWSLVGTPIYGKSPEDDFGRVEVNRDGTVIVVSDPAHNFTHPTGKYFENAGYVQALSLDVMKNEWYNWGNREFGWGTQERRGTTISISADASDIAIGSPYSSWRTGVKHTGMVTTAHIRHETGKWVGDGQFIVGEEVDDKFGAEIELCANGKILAVGTSARWTNEISGEEGVGMVRIYYFNELSRLWHRLGNDILPSGNDFTSGNKEQLDFGHSIRLSDDGKRIAIGQSKFSPSEKLTEAGRVQVFDYIEQHERWIKVGDDVVGERSCDHVGVGFDLSPDGTRLVVGYPNEANWGSESGDCAKNAAKRPVKGLVRLFELQLQPDSK